MSVAKTAVLELPTPGGVPAKRGGPGGVWACPNAHITPCGPGPSHVLEIWREGRAVKAHPVPTTTTHTDDTDDEQPITGTNQVGGGIRGSVKEFSRGSRMRLLWELNKLGRAAFLPALFVTLTYPAGEFTPVETKKHLDVMLKRIRRKFPEAAVIWKLEYTKKLTAHYHLLILGVPYWAKTTVGRAWAEIVKSNHPAHERVSTKVELVASQAQASVYMGKYIAKEQGCPDDHFGRFWGIWGPIEKHQSGRVLAPLSKEQYVKLRRVMDAIRMSHARARAAASKRKGKSGAVRRFARASNLAASQRWFQDGEAAVAVLDRLLGLQPTVDAGPDLVVPDAIADYPALWFN